MRRPDPLFTPDGRYLVVRGRLWRRTNPVLPEDERARLVQALMQARRAVRDAMRTGDARALREARAAVDAAKVSLGERGPVWWNDGAPDLNRKMAAVTVYRDWYRKAGEAGGAGEAGEAGKGQDAGGIASSDRAASSESPA